MKIPFQNREIEVIEIEVIHCNEPWSECQLADGKVLMFKDIIVNVHKAVTETNPDGSPLYLFQTHRVVRVK